MDGSLWTLFEVREFIDRLVDEGMGNAVALNSLYELGMLNPEDDDAKRMFRETFERVFRERGLL